MERDREERLRGMQANCVWDQEGQIQMPVRVLGKGGGQSEELGDATAGDPLNHGAVIMYNAWNHQGLISFICLQQSPARPGAPKHPCLHYPSNLMISTLFASYFFSFYQGHNY